MAATAHSAHTWEQRPPYRQIEGAPPFDKKLEGRCQCGRIKYWLSRDAPLTAKFCHCRGCQLLHGEKTEVLHVTDTLIVSN